MAGGPPLLKQTVSRAACFILPFRSIYLMGFSSNTLDYISVDTLNNLKVEFGKSKLCDFGQNVLESAGMRSGKFREHLTI